MTVEASDLSLTASIAVTINLTDATTARNDGDTVTLTLPAGTYTAEAAGSTGAFTLNITPN